MKFWIFEGFKGHYPVGTSAVVVAKSAEEACALLDVKLKERGLPPLEGQKSLRYFAVNTDIERAIIIQDGDY